MTDLTADTPPNLPFCELHVHLEGTLEPATIVDLAQTNGIALPYRSQDELAARYEFANLQSFLDLYYENMLVLQTEADFFELTVAYLRRAHRAGVVHAEIFVDPQAHSSRGVPEAVVLAGVQRGIAAARESLGISAAIIVGVLRDEPVSSAERMLHAVLASEVPVLGLGLDSAEVGHPPGQFRSVFDRARSAGLRCVAHAGEEGPADYIWEALDVLGVSRIDHGIRALEDADLVARLARDAVPLTVCPLSNVRLRVIDSIADLPLRRMLDRGLVVTINSDDPAYFGGYLDDNLAAVARASALGPEDLRLLAENSVAASFLPEPRKRELLPLPS
ncbi:MAG: adenosine deaminase [Actinomycetes bacterium]